jgi:archaellum component FlaC
LQINEAKESLIKPAGPVASKNFDAVDKAIAEMDQSFDEMRKKLAELSQTLSNKSLEIDSFLQKTGQIVGELTQRLTNQTTPLKQIETPSIPTLPQPVPIVPLPVTSVTPTG